MCTGLSTPSSSHCCLLQDPSPLLCLGYLCLVYLSWSGWTCLPCLPSKLCRTRALSRYDTLVLLISYAASQSTQPSQPSQPSSVPSSAASQQHRTMDGPVTHTLKYNRPAMSTFPLTILRTQMVNRTEENVDISVGVWKEKLQQE